MTDAEIIAAFWSTMLKDTKLTFWKRLQNAMEWAYEDSYQSVVNDSACLGRSASGKFARSAVLRCRDGIAACRERNRSCLDWPKDQH